jgi:HK97 family phage major capsid protein
MRLKDLRAKRARITTDLRTLADNPAGEGGDLSEEQRSRFDALKVELETTEGAITRAEFLDDAERRAAGTPITGGRGRDNFETEARSFSLVRAIAMQSGFRGIDAGREVEISQELATRMGRPAQGFYVPMEVFQKRVITTAAPAGGPGGNVIATDLLGNQYIDRLRAALVVRRMGARVLTNLVGNIDIPRLKTSANAGWFAENSTIPSSDQEFDKVSMTPKHVGVITEFSRNMLLQSTPDIEELIRDDFAKVLAEEMDRVALRGGGPNEPTGVLGTAGIGDVDMNVPTWDGVLALIEAVESANATGTGWIGSPLVKRRLMNTRKVAGTDSVMIMERSNDLAGYPFASTTLSWEPGSPDSAALIFGDWSEVLIGMWSALDILVNPYESTAYSKGNVQVRGIITADVEVRHPESFAAADNVGPGA